MNSEEMAGLTHEALVGIIADHMFCASDNSAFVFKGNSAEHKSNGLIIYKSSDSLYYITQMSGDDVVYSEAFVPELETEWMIYGEEFHPFRLFLNNFNKQELLNGRSVDMSTDDWNRQSLEDSV